MDRQLTKASRSTLQVRDNRVKTYRRDSDLQVHHLVYRGRRKNCGALQSRRCLSTRPLHLLRITRRAVRDGWAWLERLEKQRGEKEDIPVKHIQQQQKLRLSSPPSPNYHLTPASNLLPSPSHSPKHLSAVSTPSSSLTSAQTWYSR